MPGGCDGEQEGDRPVFFRCQCAPWENGKHESNFADSSQPLDALHHARLLACKAHPQSVMHY
eukprot:scaffold61565_cov18-Tisochrysis_lutea.AAC.2